MERWKAKKNRLERWSATENVTGALERSKKKGWSARVLELRKRSWSAGKLRKIGWSAGTLILNCMERWSARQKNRWSVEQRYVLERWSAEKKRGGALERYEKRAGVLERCYPWTGPRNPSFWGVLESTLCENDAIL